MCSAQLFQLWVMKICVVYFNQEEQILVTKLEYLGQLRQFYLGDLKDAASYYQVQMHLERQE